MSLPPVAQARATQSQASRSAFPSSSLVLAAIVLIGALLRLIALGRKSFWLDEIASVAIARRPLPVFLHFLWREEGNMALYYALLKPWLHLGYNEAAVRMLSVIAGVLSLPMMYALGKRLFGRDVGILATALLALNACAISVSQEARAYSFVVLAVLLSTLLFVRLIEAPSHGRMLAYALVAGLTCYFHYFGVLVPAAHAGSILALPAERRPWKPLFAAWGIIAVLAAPILWLMHAQDVGHISWLAPPSWLELYHLGVFVAADGGKAVGGVLLGIELVLAGLFVARFSRIWRDDDQLQRWRYALVASAIATPVIITLLVSIIRPAFYHRFLIICLPGWLLMIAIALTQIRLRGWRTAAIFLVCGLSLAATVLLYRRVTEDWRSAVAYLVAMTRPDDRVLYYQSVGQFAVENYRDWLQPPNAARPGSIAINPGNPDWQREIEHAPRVWLVLFRAKPDDEASRAIAAELSKNYAPVSVNLFRDITVIEYKAE